MVNNGYMISLLNGVLGNTSDVTYACGFEDLASLKSTEWRQPSKQFYKWWK